MRPLLYLKDVVTLAFDPERCTGCGMCLAVCPREVFLPSNGKVEVALRDACMECGACRQNCPHGALSVRPGVGCASAVINSMLGRKKACCVIDGDSCPSCEESAGKNRGLKGESMNLLIVGGSDAGISAALRATELDPAIAPTVIVGDNFPNFSICGLPYYVSHEVADWKNLAHRTKEDIEAEGIRLLPGRTVTSVDTGSKQVTITDESGTTSRLGYDKLIIGTGALSLRPRMTGLDNPGVFLLRTLPDSFAIEEFLKRKAPKKAVIVGGGYIGMEMCEALTTRGIEVTVVEYTESVMTSIEADFSLWIRDTLTRHGVTVYTGIGVESIGTKEDELIVQGTDGFSLPADMVLVAVGAVPHTALGRSIGIETGVKGAIKVNRRMETNIPDIYAAGDCAETWHRVLQKNTYMPLGTVAHKQGRVAGENALGGTAEFDGTLGTQAVKIFDKVVARTGLNAKEARDAGFAPVTADLETWDHKVYYPTASTLHIRVTADGETKKLLGAQMIGAYGTEVSKRIDIVAAALYHGATVDEFMGYDLSYTPPLSSPWDPVQMAIRKLEGVLSAPASRGALPL